MTYVLVPAVTGQDSGPYTPPILPSASGAPARWPLRPLPVGALEPPRCPTWLWLMRGGGGRPAVGRSAPSTSRWHGFHSHGLQNPCHLPGWGRHTCLPVPQHPRRPGRPDAKRRISPELSICLPVPQHRADRRKRTRSGAFRRSYLSPAGGDRYAIPSRSTAPPGGSGREAEHSAGVIPGRFPAFRRPGGCRRLRADRR